MAGIDKTYSDSWKEYSEFKAWADKQEITFYDGYKIRISDSIYSYDESDFTGRYLPIMNTNTSVDIYLIQNCPFKFVIDRMKSVYNEETYKEFKTVDLTAKPPEDYKQNRRIVIVKNKHTKFKLHNKPFGYHIWWLQSDSWFTYNDDSKRWVSGDSFYPSYTNTSHLKTVKAVIRHLRKQYLPKDIEFTLSGRYIGEYYTIYIR